MIFIMIFTLVLIHLKILNDRKNDFYNHNFSLCEENCEYQDFNLELRKANVNAILKLILYLIKVKLNYLQIKY